MATILVADDDPSMLLALELALSDQGYEVVTAVDGRAALALLEMRDVQVVVSDVNMPHIDGFTLTRTLRAREYPTAIILLTSRDTELDEALGLELGADDYVAKPFSMRVLTARIAALLRRAKSASPTAREHPPSNVAAALSPHGQDDDIIRRGELLLDENRLLVSFRGVPLTMTVSEFRLLECLVARPGFVISRARLLEQVRGDDSVVGDRIIDTYVGRLRRKFEAIDENFRGIETVVGAGYRWRE